MGIEEEKRFRVLIENLSDIITIVDAQGKIKYISPSVEKVLGYSADELMGKNIIGFIHQDDLPVVIKTFNSILETSGVSVSIQLRIKHNDGSWKHIEDIVSNFLHEPCISGVVINSRDITNRKLTEQGLKAEKESLAITLRSIGEGVITTDTGGRIVLMNKAAEELTGWAHEEAFLKPLGDVFRIIDRKSRREYKSPLRKVLKPRKASGIDNHTVLISKDDTERIISDTGALIHDCDNNVIGTVVVFRDITEKLMAEEELLKVDKIETLGILAGGIAHDFNNILTILLGNISLAIMYLKGANKERTLDRLIDIEKASLQAKDLTQQLFTLAKGGMPSIKTVHISELLKDTISFALSGSNILGEYTIPNSIWPVEVDEGQISQVFNNLIINAQQAMPEGGVIRVSAENEVVNENSIRALRSGNYVKITIEDTGTGIPEENLHKVFEPYFTTKPKGSGLGLTTSYAIIKKHNGHIKVKSKAGEGTSFEIYLPASENNVEDKKAEEEIIKNRGRILVMDDEKAVREVMGMMLNHIGYEVDFAVNGVEALEIYGKWKSALKPFDAVIMDLTIPGGMGGREAIKKFLETDPDVRAIASSGYSNDTLMMNFREYGFKGVIAKPFKMQDLSRILNDIIRETNV